MTEQEYSNEPTMAKDSKKSTNPVMKFVTDSIIKPFDKFSEGLLSAIKKAGLEHNLQYPFYLSQDTLWWNVMHSLFDFNIYGSEHIPPVGEAAVLCVNHQSMFDPIIFCVSIAHYTRRKLHTMAKIELFKTPFVNSYIRWNYAFPIKRGVHDTDAYNHSLELLRKGELVGIYPEGTLNGGEYDFLEPKTGAARLAIEAGVPLIPLGISGSDRILGKHMRLPSLNTKLTIKIGEPINVHKKYPGGEIPPKKVLEGIMTNVMDRIRELLVY
ncbi:hypothetical protein GF325_16310 [Candidatus Bathyarchaeota archaeon]|nr:hypothetical protein [Candidatus Bathyarchaeota archaeon]